MLRSDWLLGVRLVGGFLGGGFIEWSWFYLNCLYLFGVLFGFVCDLVFIGVYELLCGVNCLVGEILCERWVVDYDDCLWLVRVV